MSKFVLYSRISGCCLGIYESYEQMLDDANYAQEEAVEMGFSPEELVFKEVEETTNE
jgi:hypothetical protein